MEKVASCGSWVSVELADGQGEELPSVTEKDPGAQGGADRSSPCSLARTRRLTHSLGGSKPPCWTFCPWGSLQAPPLATAGTAGLPLPGWHVPRKSSERPGSCEDPILFLEAFAP